MGDSAMKPQAIEDVWRHLTDANRGVPQVTEYFTGNVEGFERTTLTLHGYLHAICGVNSSGKTRLLRQLYRDVLEDSPYVNYQGSDSFRKDRVHFVDVAWLVHRQREGTGSFSNFNDLVEESASIALSERELAIARYLCGHRYEEILIWEVEDVAQHPLEDFEEAASDSEEDADDATNSEDAGSFVDRPAATAPETGFRPEQIPFFRVTREGQNFDTRTLSRGELTGLTLMWVFRQAEKHSLFLIDEPEVYLSPDSAGKILEVIAWWTDRRDSQSIVATHAAGALENIDTKLLTLLAPNNARPPIVEVKKASVDTLYTHLRLKATPTHVFVVEDVSAERLAKRLLQEAEFKHLDRSSFWIAKGEVGVRHASNLPQFPNSGLEIVALADGDEEPKKSRNPKYGSSVVFLPISSNFEQFIIDTSLDWSASCGSPDPSRVSDGLNLAKGHDAHSGLEILASHVGMTGPTLAFNVLDWWLTQSDGRKQFERFKRDIDSLLPGSVEI